MVDNGREVNSAVKVGILTNAVKDYYVIVNRESDDCQQCCQEERVCLPTEEVTQDCLYSQCHQDIMDGGNDGSCAVPE